VVETESSGGDAETRADLFVQLVAQPLPLSIVVQGRAGWAVSVVPIPIDAAGVTDTTGFANAAMLTCPAAVAGSPAVVVVIDRGCHAPNLLLDNLDGLRRACVLARLMSVVVVGAHSRDIGAGVGSGVGPDAESAG
jgi:hypothetical protein